MAAEGDATNSARLLQEEGPAPRLEAAAVAPSQPLFPLQQEQHETSVSWWLAHFVQTACFAGVWISLGSALVKPVHIFMHTNGKRPAPRSSIWPTFRPRAWALQWSPDSKWSKYKWNQIPLGGKLLCSGLFEITNQMLEQEQAAKKFKISLFPFTHSSQS